MKDFNFCLFSGPRAIQDLSYHGEKRSASSMVIDDYDIHADDHDTDADDHDADADYHDDH